MAHHGRWRKKKKKKTRVAFKQSERGGGAGGGCGAHLISPGVLSPPLAHRLRLLFHLRLPLRLPHHDHRQRSRPPLLFLLFPICPASFWHNSRLADPVFDALVNYAASSNSSGKMGDADLRTIAAVLRRRSPCNFLVFGLDHETPLWRALNHGGRTVSLDENEYYIAHLEGRLSGLEAYDIAYTTKVREMPDLIAASRRGRQGDCRPIQNLLFSDCRLALNDLPSALYDIPWDVILVDGPRGYAATAPGRMSTIFTAVVMARSAGLGPIDVLVHDYEREVEQVCNEEFLYTENLVANTSHAVSGTLGRL